MGKARVTRALDVPADALWKLVSSFGDTSWMPAGAPGTRRAPRPRAAGPGMRRRTAAGPDKVIRERLEFVDAASRTLVYTIPENVPFPVTDYRATMRVRAKGKAGGATGGRGGGGGRGRAGRSTGARASSRSVFPRATRPRPSNACTA